jgi:hypothetical protein
MKQKLYLPLILIIPLVALSLLLAHEAHVAKKLGFPLDDAWIFWVFAKNLATGNGLSFNPGQAVLGTTSVLWVFVLAGSYFVTHNVVLISKFWGMVFFLLTIFLTFRICLLYTEQEKIAFLSVLSVALAPPLIYGALSGMEISLASFLLCLTIFFHLREKGERQNTFLAPVLGAFCFMARPELVLLYPLLLADYYLRSKKEKSLKSNVFKKLSLFVGIIFLYSILSHIVTGSMLPNTFAAKALDSGFIWAVRNGNLDELFISLTLNPFVWGGSMLVTLFCLNVFWAFFWGKGLVLSFLKRETLIYPLIFFLIPMLRGIIAPVGNSLSAEHRYVSFLLPLLAILFVIGWKGSGQREKARSSKSSLRKLLFCVGGVAAILAVFFYLNPLVRKDEILGWLSGFYFPSIQAKRAYLDFSTFRFIFAFVVVFICGVGLLGTTKYLTRVSAGRKFISLLLILGIALQLGFVINWAQRYALSVKNINQMQLHLGKWMNQNIPQRSLVAIHDVGALKFFGNRECLDLEGLVSPQIIPYKILGTDSYIVYLNKHRPDYFIIFVTYYPSLVTFLGLQNRISYQVELERNIASGGGGIMIVAEPDWELFDKTFQNTGLLDIKPYIPKKTFKRRWFDAQERQGLFPAWRVYQMRGREEERRGDLKEAERFYKKAESYDPQHHEFYLQLAAFYEKKGDNARVMSAFRKSVKYQLFPPP